MNAPSTLTIAGLRTEPGEKRTGFLPVAGTALELPLTLVNGSRSGATLLVTAGIHGGEYPCIEAAIRLAATLEAAELAGRVIVLPLVSPSSFRARQAFFVPEDGKNLNRQFPGSTTGTVSDRIAHAVVTEVAAHADAWIDLHGGDIPEALVPLLGLAEGAAPDVFARGLAMAEVFGIEHLVVPGHLSGTTLAAAADVGIPALLAEAGQLGRFDETDTDLLYQGCLRVATHLGIVPGEPPPVCELIRYRDWPWVRAGQDGLWYPEVEVGAHVEEGQVIGTLRDVFGATLEHSRAPATGIVLLLWSALAVNRGEPLFGIGIR
ncbi:MAG: succinylglutamate desuccinylase/aspartoacylase family protein [Trueperaceae bacterium]|nr:MAG: succinylglutamate desuccinylase/aspartoacylase family protein [Trueperaceae bacterium]